MMKLDFLLNMKVIVLCLSFPKRYNILNLDIPSENCTQNTKGYSGGMAQWGALGLNGNVMKLAQLFSTFFC